MRKIFSILLAFCLLLSLSACGKEKTEIADENTASEIKVVTDIDTENMDLEFTNNDRDSSYDEADIINLSDNDIVITAAGTYKISGSHSSVTVKAGENDKLKIVLENADIISDNGPAIYIEQADKVFITIPDGTKSSLSDSAEYDTSYDNTDGVIFSKADLTINGNGTLEINSEYKCGIVSKDDLVICDTNINVSSIGAAIEGKDCVKITSALLNLDAGTDGIKSTNTEDETRGYILLDSGEYNITSSNDAIQAATALFVNSGNFTLSSGGGSAISSSNNNDWGMWGPRFDNQTSSQDTESAKALKGGMLVKISGGNFAIDSSDDAIHSNSDIEINSGSFNIASGDDGIHADDQLLINGGDIVITKSYEGIEATVINVTNGNIDVTASDDGFNAAGGNDSSALGGRPGQNTFESDNESIINIAGGYIVVNASGDGIDSNGDISVTGGVLLVSGPENSGNGALDYGGNATISGGTAVITGSSGMAQGFSSGSSQVSYMSTLNNYQNGGDYISVCSGEKVIASFLPQKQYNCVVISSPSLEIGKSYTINFGGTVLGADKNGYTDNGSVSGAENSLEIDITAVTNGSSGGFNGDFGGGMQGGGMGKPR